MAAASSAKNNGSVVSDPHPQPHNRPHLRPHRHHNAEEVKRSSQNKNNTPEQRPPALRRPPRACTTRTVPPPPPPTPTPPARSRPAPSKDGEPSSSSSPMPLLPQPPPLCPQWGIRGTWELASVANFFNVFRPVLKLGFDFSIEELENGLLTPNATLDNIHIALLKAIPPINRVPITHDGWVTVLCKKLKDWWPWVAEGPFPLVPYHGEEIAMYKELDPGARVIILKALCEVRVDQEDLRSYLDNSLKQGVALSTFRKERTGVDMLGSTYWYENDPVMGHRLYRELRRVENKDKTKARGSLTPPPSSCTWETLATNLDEFQTVAEKLISSRNRLEVVVGKRVKENIIPVIEEAQKKKEKALKKQQRQAVLLDNSLISHDGLTSGRSRRERKPVTYTFDDYDRSIIEAINFTKKQPASSEPIVKNDTKATNGHIRNTEQIVANKHANTSRKMMQEEGSQSTGSEPAFGTEPQSRRQLRRPQRYSINEYVEMVSDNEADDYSDDEIEGEAVYDAEYMGRRQKMKASLSSGDDEEYREDEEEDGDEEEEEDDEVNGDMMGASDDDDYYIREKRRCAPSGREKRKSGRSGAIESLESGLRRSKRVTRSKIDYSRYGESDYEMEDSVPVGEETRINDSETNRVSDVKATDSENRESYDSASSELKPLKNEAALDMADFETVKSNGIGCVSNGQVSPKEEVCKDSKKQHMFFDLNLAIPQGGTHEDDNGANAYAGDVC